MSKPQTANRLQSTHEEITLRLPTRLVQRLEREAATSKRSVSRIVAKAMSDRYKKPRGLDRKTWELMIKGYKEWAEENVRLANEWNSPLGEPEQ